jgi:hypothetical protein
MHQFYGGLFTWVFNLQAELLKTERGASAVPDVDARISRISNRHNDADLPRASFT